MKIESEFLFAGSRVKLWELLLDPEIMAKAIPGTESLEKVSEDEFKGVMSVGVGPVNGKFSIELKLTDMIAPESYNMNIFAKGAPGFLKGTARIELYEKSENETIMKYSADLNIGGKIAIVGQRLLDTIGKSMTNQALESLNRELQNRLNQE